VISVTGSDRAALHRFKAKDRLAKSLFIEVSPDKKITPRAFFVPKAQNSSNKFQVDVSAPAHQSVRYRITDRQVASSDK